ncbi:Coenzyme Q-binding protein coq10a, mitochondrial [Gryganskiella cystojenkinii]|nr:Coenzyme Q-binding protein coq10a, mitochondrial [Gryganskiella cystojenkinii]
MLLAGPGHRLAAATSTLSYYRLGQEIHRHHGLLLVSAAISSPQRNLADRPLTQRHQPPHQQCQRSLFTLPKIPKLPTLPDLLNTSSFRHYKDRTLLKYSQQEFFDVVANVDDYHKFLPWCTYSKMSSPVREDGAFDKSGQPDMLQDQPSQGTKLSLSDMKPASPRPVSSSTTTTATKQPVTTVRHGELGIGFNAMQERYVSTVTCQEPWMVRAVSYDSNLFKELSTTWKFTPNVPKTTTLEAAMDQEVKEERSLLTRPVQEVEAEISEPQPPQLTAAAVFGAASLPTLKNIQPLPPRPTYPSSSSAPFPAPPNPTIQRTASPSNLATMNPSDYPSVWVDFEIQFEFASPVHASMSSLFFDQVSKEMLQAFVKRAEFLYGKRY